jgi:hypothetical protein
LGYPDGYPTAYGTPPDQAFLWRIGDFANDKTCIGLILHGKPFFSNETAAKKAKESLLIRFKPRVIVNLSKLRREHIFPNSEAPTMILIAEGKQSEPRDSFYFVCPERSIDFRRHGIVEIGAEHIKKLPVFSTSFDSDILKIATWGSARDMYLIQKLEEFPNIEQIAGNLPKNGFKYGHHQKAPQELINKKCLASSKMPRYQINIDELELPPTTMESPRNSEIYKAPLVIISQSVDGNEAFAAFSEEDIVYTQRYSGISFAKNNVHLAHYLNGIINSSITSYFLFLTASSWGIERNEIKTQDLERLRVPELNEGNKKLIFKIIEIEGKLREYSSNSLKKDLKKQLDETVYNLYGLDDRERILIEDTTQITIDLYMNGEKSTALRRPLAADLEAYTIQFMSVIKPFLQTLNERSIAADIFSIPQAPLQVVQFSMAPYPGREPLIQTVQAGDLMNVLKSIGQQLPSNQADRVFSRRNARIYIGDYLYIIKPAQLRYWSRSAGLNDADTVLAEHLRNR